MNTPRDLRLLTDDTCRCRDMDCIAADGCLRYLARNDGTESTPWAMSLRKDEPVDQPCVHWIDHSHE